jgi:hypothetical protein
MTDGRTTQNSRTDGQASPRPSKKKQKKNPAKMPGKKGQKGSAQSTSRRNEAEISALVAREGHFTRRGRIAPTGDPLDHVACM